MGTILSCVYSGSIMGAKYISLFDIVSLCSLMVISTLLFITLCYGKTPNEKIIFCVTVSPTGTAFLTLGGDSKIQMSILKGDLISILVAVAYVNHLFYTERTARKSPQDVFSPSTYQFLLVRLTDPVLAATFKKPSPSPSGMNWPVLIFPSVFCTGLVFTL